MRPLAIALALSTLFTTSCANKPPARALVLTPDPARLGACPRLFPIPPTLTPIQSFKLPDGREVVLFDTVLDRETATARYIIKARGVWHDCMSAAVYVEDWSHSARQP